MYQFCKQASTYFSLLACGVLGVHEHTEIWWCFLRHICAWANHLYGQKRHRLVVNTFCLVFKSSNGALRVDTALHTLNSGCVHSQFIKKKNGIAWHDRKHLFCLASQGARLVQRSCYDLDGCTHTHKTSVFRTAFISCCNCSLQMMSISKKKKI